MPERSRLVVSRMSPRLPRTSAVARGTFLNSDSLATCGTIEPIDELECVAALLADFFFCISSPVHSSSALH